MNNHEHTLIRLRDILNLAIKGEFINFNSHYIFRTTAHDESLRALKAFFTGGEAWDKNMELKSLFPEGPLNWEQDDKKIIKDTKEFIAKYNTHHVHPIDEYVWAVVCKQTFQNSTILNFDSISALASWNIFLQQLRSMHAALRTNAVSKEENPYLKLDEEAVQNTWIDFLSQMYQNGHHRIVEVIHNYLYLACMASKFCAAEEVRNKEIQLQSVQAKEKQKVCGEAAAPQNNGLDLKGISLMMNPPLLDGLEIAGKIVMENDREAVKAEFHFMAEVLRIFLKMPHRIFNSPYHSREYRHLRRGQADYQSESESLQQILWDKLPTLNIPFRQMLVAASAPEVDNLMSNLTLDEDGASAAPAALDQQSEIDKEKPKFKIPFLNYIIKDKDRADSPKKRNDSASKQDTDAGKKESSSPSAPTRKSSPKGPDGFTAMKPGPLPRQPSPKERNEIITRQGSSGSIKPPARVSFGRTDSDRHLTPPGLGSSPTSPKLLNYSSSGRLPKFPSQESPGPDVDGPRQYVPAYQLVGFVSMPAVAGSESGPSPAGGMAYIVPSTPVDIPVRVSGTEASSAPSLLADTSASTEGEQRKNKKGL